MIIRHRIIDIDGTINSSGVYQMNYCCLAFIIYVICVIENNFYLFLLN